MEKIDTALRCLVTIARLLGIPADEQQLQRAYSMDDKGIDQFSLMRAAKELGLKSRLLQRLPERFAKLPLPAMFLLKNNNWVVVLRSDGQTVFMVDPYYPNVIGVPLDKFFSEWSGQVLLVAKRFVIQEKVRKFGLSWFFPIIIQYKSLFGQVLFLSLILQLIGLLSPVFTKVIIDEVLVHRSVNTLNMLMIGMIVVNVFQTVLGGVRSYLFSYTTNKIDVVLSAKIFRHISNLPIKYFETWQVGDVVSRVRELEQVRSFITGSALTVVLDVVFATIYIAVLFSYNSILTIITLGVVLLFVILNLVVTPIYKTLLNRLFQIGSESQSFLIESITGIQTVKTLAVEAAFIQRWEQMLSRLIKTAFTVANVSNVAGNIGGFIQQAFNLCLLWIGARTVLEGNLSMGELIAFQMMAGQVIGPILRLVNLWQSFQKTMVSVDRLGDILNDVTEPAFNPNRTTLPAIEGSIVLDRVTFRYKPDGREILRQVSLDIPAGARVGVVGRSGSGKSTLTKLIQRLYVPESGRVLIDGVDLAQIEPAWLRRQIGVVLQDNFLFNGSVRDNIATAKPNATQEEILHVAQIAGAHEFIMELAEGYDTAVGERGTSLSGGQRQRIAIARALLPNPSILIFDEATSALDYESEKIIMDNLDQIANGRTMIMIAHRLSTIRKADVILVIDKGMLAESGTHDELLTQQGIYHHLYRQQER
ncbi:peptidase domain-containing ABC transporter [Pelosinus sp. sgz500959]|uniref:peptidase domain-containing ABC transporter n=1 Tax=Pelosinus sp. sgz500959 TaxID=3242472 RepID=UPI00366DF075